jgi:chromosome segregation ATPase
MDRIDLLEARIKQMLDLVQSLRDENQSLRARLEAAEARTREITEERKTLDRERDVVRGRIEQLLGELGEIEAATTPKGGASEARAERRDYADNPVLPGLT